MDQSVETREKKKEEEEESVKHRRTDRQLPSIRRIRRFPNTLPPRYLLYSSSSAPIRPLHPQTGLLSAGVSGEEGMEFPSFLLSGLGVMRSVDR